MTSKQTSTASVLDLIAVAPATASQSSAQESKSLRDVSKGMTTEVLRVLKATDQPVPNANAAQKDLTGAIVGQVRDELLALAARLTDAAADLDADGVKVWSKNGKTARVTANVMGGPKGVWASAGVSITLDGTLGSALAKVSPRKESARKTADAE